VIPTAIAAAVGLAPIVGLTAALVWMSRR